MSADSRAGGDALSLSLELWLDKECSRFEAAWKAGQRPRIEDYLDDAAEPRRSALLQELLRVELEYRSRDQEGPTEEEYRRRFPDQGERIRKAFHLVMSRGDPAVGARPAKPGGETKDDGPVSRGAETPPPAASAGMPVWGDLPRVEGFQVLVKLGAGGMGVVYKARHLRLKRLVALKMIRAGVHADEENLERFRTEYEAIARLQHPYIVQVYEVGEHGGLPYFALEFCPGGSLDKQLGGTPLPPKEAAALVEKLAGAMHAVHAKNVLHRDLKPANVLLAEDGTPKITDFGLAKKLDEAGRTVTGAVMGTPSYMAPEQAGGRSKDLTAAADIYALGAILYECLTGRPPFRAATPLDTLVQVVSDDPVPPQQLNPQVPRDLETICLKCLRKEPPKRYATAADLADDLGRWQRREPIRGRPVGLAERGTKWVRRNRAVAGLAASVLVSLMTGTVVAAYFAVRATAELKEKNETLAVSTVLLGHREWYEDNVRRGLEFLDNVPAHLRHWEWGYLKRLLHGGHFTLEGSSGPLAFSPDGQRLAVTRDGTWRVLDAQTGEELCSLPDLTHGLTDVAFSPDGQHLATASPRGVTLWDARTGQELPALKGRTDGVVSVAFSPDGERLATAGKGGARVLDARTGREVLALMEESLGPSRVAFSPDGRRVAAAGDRGVQVWDAQTGQGLFALTKDATLVGSLAFSPDGRYLATASQDRSGAVRLWDDQGRAVRTLQGHTSAVVSVAFSPDGQRLASGGGEVKVWDVATGQETLLLKGYVGQVSSVAFSPDGQRLATASADGRAKPMVKVWDARGAPEAVTVKAHVRPVTAVAFRPDGRQLSTASADGAARVWDALSGQPVATLRGHTGAVTAVAYGPDGRLATASHDRTVRIWEGGTGRELQTLPVQSALVTGAVFSPDGRLLATASQDQTVKVWEAATGQERLALHERTGPLAFSPDGQHLASVLPPDPPEVERQERLMGRNRPPEKWAVGLCEVRAGRETVGFTGHTGPVTGVAFSPGGRLLATASQDRTARVWEVRTGREVWTLQEHAGPLTGLAFSPDGRRLATASEDRTVKIWDVSTGLKLLTLKGHPGPVNGVAFSPDGRRLAAACQDGTVWVWQGWFPADPADPEELAYRRAMARPDPRWHEEQAARWEKAGQGFAAAFHRRQARGTRSEPAQLLQQAQARAESGQWNQAQKYLEQAMRWLEAPSREDANLPNAARLSADQRLEFEELRRKVEALLNDRTARGNNHPVGKGGEESAVRARGEQAGPTGGPQKPVVKTPAPPARKEAAPGPAPPTEPTEGAVVAAANRQRWARALGIPVPWDPTHTHYVPSLPDLTDWFGACLVGVFLPGLLVGLALARFRAVLVGWSCTAFLLAMAGPSLVGLCGGKLLFTWPAALFVAFQANLQEIHWVERQPDRKARRWRSRLTTYGLLGFCGAYWALCWKADLHLGWGFLFGLLPALPMCWLAAALVPPRGRWYGYGLSLLVAFTVYFWSSGLFVRWRML
jgi:eukaryotic-like serine/threonine-protein kinase